MNGSQDLYDYLLKRQCAHQWRGFLNALSTEFSDQLSAEDLRLLVRKIGVRFAGTTALPVCRTIQDIQNAANRVWSEIDWGYVRMEEGSGCLRIVHHFAPLQSAFGSDALAWSPAYLEGVYHQWFAACGAGGGLDVKQASDLDTAGTVEYRLGL